VIRCWKFKFVLKCVMQRSRIAEYGYRFRSDSATTRTAKKSD